jgi:hypothetical protein
MSINRGRTVRNPYGYRSADTEVAVKVVKAVFILVGYAALLVGAYFFTAFLLMIAAGVVHSVWLTMMPTMGYKAALLMAWIPGVFFSGCAASGSKSK